MSDFTSLEMPGPPASGRDEADRQIPEPTAASEFAGAEVCRPVSTAGAQLMSKGRALPMEYRHLVIIIFILATGLTAFPLVAEPDAPEDPAVLAAIINDIRPGWEQADGTRFEKNYLNFDGARYIESGGQNVGLRDLIDHHVEPEGEALENLALTFSNIEIHFEGDFAWAIADVDMQATFRSDGRPIHNSGYDTFLFRFVAGAWKVMHTHSSSRPAKK